MSIIKADAENNMGLINRGMAAVRFLTIEIANLFERFFHGLEVYYVNWKQTDARGERIDHRREDRERNRVRPEMEWYYTKLEVAKTDPRKKRGFRMQEFPHRNLLQRGPMPGKHQHCLYQAHFAPYDYVQWPTVPITCGPSCVGWQANPYSGIDFLENRRYDRGFRPFLPAPDATYWRAMGFMHPRLDLSAKPINLGCWINNLERQIAYEDDNYWTAPQDAARLPYLNQYLAGGYAARRRPGRAVSRVNSRTPPRR